MLVLTFVYEEIGVLLPHNKRQRRTLHVQGPGLMIKGLMIKGISANCIDKFYFQLCSGGFDRQLTRGHGKDDGLRFTEEHTLNPLVLKFPLVALRGFGRSHGKFVVQWRGGKQVY